MTRSSIDAVQDESERFLKEEAGATKYRHLNIVEFTQMVVDNGIRGEDVQVRNFSLEGNPLVQMYIKIKEEHVYATVLDR